MENQLRRLASFIDSVSLFFARIAGWLSLILVLLTVEQVLARYLFSASSVGLQELEWHLFGAIFLLGAANTLREDGHVRVDLVYGRLSQRNRAIVDLIGILFFLIPVCIVLVVYGYYFTASALDFANPRPADYYLSSISAPGDLLYSLLAPIEGFIRGNLLLGEISSDPGGLEGRWIIKGLIPFGFLLLALQGIALFLKKLPGAFQRQVTEEDSGGS